MNKKRPELKVADSNRIYLHIKIVLRSCFLVKIEKNLISYEGNYLHYFLIILQNLDIKIGFISLEKVPSQLNNILYCSIYFYQKNLYYNNPIINRQQQNMKQMGCYIFVELNKTAIKCILPSLTNIDQIEFILTNFIIFHYLGSQIELYNSALINFQFYKYQNIFLLSHFQHFISLKLDLYSLFSHQSIKILIIFYNTFLNIHLASTSSLKSLQSDYHLYGNFPLQQSIRLKSLFYNSQTFTYIFLFTYVILQLKPALELFGNIQHKIKTAKTAIKLLKFILTLIFIANSLFWLEFQ